MIFRWRASRQPVRRERISNVELGKRVTTAPARTLPHFFIVGAQKAGTTSLLTYLEQHPAIKVGVRKELHFFDHYLDRTRFAFPATNLWYRAWFPMRRHLKSGDVVGEASPMYLFHPLAAERIYRVLPNARILILVRDPVERAVSHYWHSRRLGTEDLELLPALEAEEGRISTPWTLGDFQHPSIIHHSYKSRGRYAEQIARYINLFGANRILIIRSERLLHYTEYVVQRVFDFLELSPPRKTLDLTNRNVGETRRTIAPEVRSNLEAYFGPLQHEYEAVLRGLEVV